MVLPVRLAGLAVLVPNRSVLCLAGVGVLCGQLYATGGHDGPLVRKSVEVYDPGKNAWKQVADMNMCRRNAGNVRALPGLETLFLQRPVLKERQRERLQHLGLSLVPAREVSICWTRAETQGKYLVSQGRAPKLLLSLKSAWLLNRA